MSVTRRQGIVVFVLCVLVVAGLGSAVAEHGWLYLVVFVPMSLVGGFLLYRLVRWSEGP